MLGALRRIWGGWAAGPTDHRRVVLVDLIVVAGIVGIAFGVIQVAHEWRGSLRPAVEIDLSPLALPRYTLFSLSRGLAAYVLSLGFTLGYGYWAAKDARAERLLIPLLDILQSIPVLGFMPGLVLALVGLFPRTNVGLELAAVLMIFTGQAWNMTFSFYHSLRAVPADQREVAALYRFSGWQRLKSVELPFATTGLVWNSMMSMAGGWFFLMITESFELGNKDFRLPGVGSYMSVAVARGNVPAMLAAMGAMVTMIVALDQLLWRPLVAWAQRFRIEESSAEETASSWFLTVLRRSTVIERFGSWFHDVVHGFGARAARTVERPRSTQPARTSALVSVVLFVVLSLGLGLGALRLVQLLSRVSIPDLTLTTGRALVTLGRVLLSTFIGTLWTVPAGLAIGLSPRLSRLLQPVVQIAASFPAPMLFPIAIAVLRALHVELGWGSIVLMLLGTQWYILFNVIAGASAVPSDLREAARSYHLTLVQRFWRVYAPALFPFLVTGWVTAAGGAWNASIVAEFVTFRGQVLTATGLGSEISQAAANANLPLLAAAVTVMSISVVVFNRLVWRNLYHLAESRFSLSK